MAVEGSRHPEGNEEMEASVQPPNLRATPESGVQEPHDVEGDCDDFGGGNSDDEEGAEYEISQEPSDDDEEQTLTMMTGVTNEQFSEARGKHYAEWANEEITYTVHPFEGPDDGEVNRDDERLTNKIQTCLENAENLKALFDAS